MQSHQNVLETVALTAVISTSKFCIKIHRKWSKTGRERPFLSADPGCPEGPWVTTSARNRTAFEFSAENAVCQDQLKRMVGRMRHFIKDIEIVHSHEISATAAPVRLVSRSHFQGLVANLASLWVLISTQAEHHLLHQLIKRLPSLCWLS